MAAEQLGEQQLELVDIPGCSETGRKAEPQPGQRAQHGLLVGPALVAQTVDAEGDDLQTSLAERGAVVEVAPGLPAVRGDRPQLTELVRHLVANALRFVEAGKTPRIEIGARPEGGVLARQV